MPNVMELVRAAQKANSDAGPFSTIALFDMFADELRDHLARHQAAGAAWAAVRNAIIEEDPGAQHVTKWTEDMERIASNWEDHYAKNVEQIEIALEDAEKKNTKASARAGVLKKWGLKELTMKDAEAIYNSARKYYNESYAMMIDDAYKGAVRAANKRGLDVFVDVSWFRDMFVQIKNHNSWERVPPDVKERILEDMQEEQTRFTGWSEK